MKRRNFLASVGALVLPMGLVIPSANALTKPASEIVPNKPIKVFEKPNGKKETMVNVGPGGHFDNLSQLEEWMKVNTWDELLVGIVSSKATMGNEVFAWINEKDFVALKMSISYQISDLPTEPIKLNITTSQDHRLFVGVAPNASFVDYPRRIIPKSWNSIS